MPLNFSQDGARGALGNSDGSSSAGAQNGASFGSSVPINSQNGGYANDAGMNQSSSDSGSTSQSSASDSLTGTSSPFGTIGPLLSSYTVTRDPNGNNTTYDNLTGRNWASTGDDLAMGLSGSFFNHGDVNVRYADGGAVPDDTSSDVGSLLALALSSVDAGLDYGRKKYGLKQGGDNAQVASMSRTPMIPGNQSESGVPRPQPMPGPLPPTSNPFGKRQMSQNDQQGGNDADNQGGGAIPDNDADDQETA